MKTIAIQSNSLPDNWLTLIEKFDIDKSTLPDSLKQLCHILKKNILDEKENSAMSYFNRSFLRHVCLGIDWKLDKYEDIPLELIEEVFSEMGTEVGIQYDQKLSSLFSELLAYKHLYDQDYVIDSFNRTPGSCDLVLKKDDEVYHCEVKAKGSDDDYSTKILFYINGKSYLSNYYELRKLDLVYYRMKKYPSGYREIENMNKEFDTFCENPTYFDGLYIEISSDKHKTSVQKDISHNYLINSFDKIEVANQFESILIGEGRHLTKLIKKSKDFENFIGYLHFSVPFHKEMSSDDIEEWFKSQGLDFDLYVDINGVGIDRKVLNIPKIV